MALARRCDICGQLYNEYTVEAPNKQGVEVVRPIEQVNAISFEYVGDRGSICRSRTYELCPGCMDLVTMVLGLKPKEDKRG